MRSGTFVALFTTLFFIAAGSQARTFFIDYSAGNDKSRGLKRSEPWQHAPGMQGFKASYHHTPGDTFVLRGGVTWPSSTLPFAIVNSGNPGAVDCYTGDSSWYAGERFSLPAINGEHSLKQLLTADRKSFFTINNISFVGFGSAGKENGGKAVEINGCDHYTVSRCAIAPEAWIGLYLHSYSGKTESGITVKDNDLSCAGQAIVLATEAANTVMRNVAITGNHIHDLSSQLVGEVHGDGIHTWNSPQNDSTQYLRDVRISENIFDGRYLSAAVSSGASSGMTAHIYITDMGKNYLICNNVLVGDSGAKFGALLWVRSADSVCIANNTLLFGRVNGGIGIMVGEGDPSQYVSVVNNIIVGALQSYYLNPGTAATATIDHNLLTPQKETIGWVETAFKNRDEWKKSGFDLHGIVGNSGLSQKDRWMPLAGSAAIGRGVDLSAGFNNDALGKKRTVPWDIGAYGYTAPLRKISGK